MKDITALIAHADDDLLFCWPVWDRIAHIICVSSDENNPERLWCRHRKLCLHEVGKKLGADVTCLGYNSEFYRLPTRNRELKALACEVLALLSTGSGPIFSHNSHGEYGHIDHLLCHQIARQASAEFSRELLVSDIACEVDWWPIRPRPWPQGELVSRHTLDRARFDSLKAIYDARGCWTWSHEPVTECSIYRV